MTKIHLKVLEKHTAKNFIQFTFHVTLADKNSYLMKEVRLSHERFYNGLTGDQTVCL